jgi:hypothetical protein
MNTLTQTPSQQGSKKKDKNDLQLLNPNSLEKKVIGFNPYPHNSINKGGNEENIEKYKNSSLYKSIIFFF